MKFSIRRSSRFKRDLKRLLQRGKDLEKLLKVVGMLAEKTTLPPECKDHLLAGNYKDKRDCHIEPDWIMIYAIEDDELVLYRTGTHSDLFK